MARTIWALGRQVQRRLLCVASATVLAGAPACADPDPGPAPWNEVDVETEDTEAVPGVPPAMRVPDPPVEATEPAEVVTAPRAPAEADTLALVVRGVAEFEIGPRRIVPAEFLVVALETERGGREAVAMGITDRRGRFVLENVPIGEYQLVILSDEDRPQALHRVRVRIPAGVEVELPHVRIPARTLSIQGIRPN